MRLADVKRILRLLLAVSTSYLVAYLALRATQIEVRARDGRPYVIVPSGARWLYLAFRPVMYLDAAMTGMGFHIGPHANPPVVTPQASTNVPSGSCEAALKGRDGAALDADVAPKVLSLPKWKPPERKDGTCSGDLIFELLIGSNGRVEGVWTIEEPTCQPAWPQLTESARKVMWDWRFAPATIRGTPVPACAGAPLHIHWE